MAVISLIHCCHTADLAIGAEEESQCLARVGCGLLRLTQRTKTAAVARVRQRQWRRRRDCKAVARFESAAFCLLTLEYFGTVGVESAARLLAILRVQFLCAARVARLSHKDATAHPVHLVGGAVARVADCDKLLESLQEIDDSINVTAVTAVTRRRSTTRSTLQPLQPLLSRDR